MTRPQINKKRIRLNKPANKSQSGHKVKRPGREDQSGFTKQNVNISIPDDASHPDYDPGSDGIIDPNKP